TRGGATSCGWGQGRESRSTPHAAFHGGGSSEALTSSSRARHTSCMPTLESGLRRARQRSGLRQGELAARAGISRQTLSALEAGRAQPSTAIALNLARALACRLEDLFWLREDGEVVRSRLALPARGSRRALLGRVAGSWVAHPLRTDDPLSVITPADALLAHGKLRLLRPRESVEANVLLTGCEPGLAVLSGRVADRWAGQRVCWI